MIATNISTCLERQSHKGELSSNEVFEWPSLHIEQTITHNKTTQTRTFLMRRCNLVAACHLEANQRTLIGIKITRNIVISTNLNTSSAWRPICLSSTFASPGQQFGSSVPSNLHLVGVRSDAGHSQTLWVEETMWKMKIPHVRFWNYTQHAHT